LAKQNQSQGIPEKNIIHVAIKSMGLDELGSFSPKDKIIEYRISSKYGELANSTIENFVDELSSNSPAPGGGSVSALSGSMSAGLLSMVANLTIGKKGYKDKHDAMNELAVKGQKLKDKLLQLIDDDTNSFNGVMDAMRLPKKTDVEKSTRYLSIQAATKEATKIPLNILKTCADILALTLEASVNGNQNSISDVGVSAEMSYAGSRGAALNVLINLADIEDEDFCKEMRHKVSSILSIAENDLQKVRSIIDRSLSK